MDSEIEETFEEIKKLVKNGEYLEAVNAIDEMLKNDEYKPYEKALKKIKIDVIYTLNLARIEPELAEKAKSKIESELKLSQTPEKDEKEQNKKVSAAQDDTLKPTKASAAQKKVGAPKKNPISPVPPPTFILPPPTAIVPVELMKTDPYDFDKIKIEEEIGPMGLIKDIHRTIISITDPFLPTKLLKKMKTNSK